MHGYPLFVAIALITVLSPGPGVVMTLTNTLRYGVGGALAGIFGIASGTMIVALSAALGLGTLLTCAPTVLNALQYLGALYLIYLGMRLWRPQPHRVAATSAPTGWRHRWIAGVLLQFSNPKAILFFITVLPQFIDPTTAPMPQLLVLTCTYSTLVIGIHLGYAWLAEVVVQRWGGNSPHRSLQRIGGILLFGFALAVGLNAQDFKTQAL